MSTSSRRSLWNMRLTSKYRSQYLGRWVALALVQVALLNAFIYWVYTQLWGRFHPLSADPAAEIAYRQTSVLWTLGAITVLLSTAILVMAVVSAHRIGGPYIAVKRTCKAIERGDMSQRLKFRDYDRLDDVQEAFNKMMDAVEARVTEQDADSVDPPLRAAG